MGLLTSGTSGPRSSTSSSSAALQSSLESRLRHLTRTRGSTLYVMTWSHWVTPAGRLRSRLRASVPLTSEIACTGWPTPTTRDWKDGTPCENVPLNALLGRVVWLAGWPTARANDGTGDKIPPGREGGLALKQAVQLAGWLTPTAAAGGKDRGSSAGNDLRNQAKRAAGPARLTDSGELLTGSPARMDSGGPLNPAHSRWLMGLPPAWDACAPLRQRGQQGSRASLHRVRDLKGDSP
jgi:hypothetical protein